MRKKKSIQKKKLFSFLLFKKFYSAEFKLRPSVVKSIPKAKVVKSGSVIRITLNNPIKPKRSASFLFESLVQKL